MVSTNSLNPQASYTLNMEWRYSLHPYPSSLMILSFVSSNHVLCFTISLSKSDAFVLLISSFSFAAPTVVVGLILQRINYQRSGPSLSWPRWKSSLLPVISILKADARLIHSLLLIMIVCVFKSCRFYWCSIENIEISWGITSKY